MREKIWFLYLCKHCELPFVAIGIASRLLSPQTASCLPLLSFLLSLCQLIPGFI